ncbi:unnamed protein product [Prunus brigantina]
MVRITIRSRLPVSLQLVLILVHLIMGYGCMNSLAGRNSSRYALIFTLYQNQQIGLG